MVNRYHSNRGGDSVYAFELTYLLRSQGHKVIPFAMKDDEHNDKSEYTDYFVDNIDFVQSLDKSNLKTYVHVISRAFYSRHARKKVSLLIRDTMPDIAHLQTIHHHISPSIIDEFKKYRLPVVWTIHDYALVCPTTLFLSNGKICEACLGKRFYMAAFKKCKYGSFKASVVAALETYLHHAMRIIRQVDVLIAPSLFMKDKLIQHGIEDSKIVHIPNCINVKAFHPNYNCGEYVVFLGRLAREKGVTTLLRAMKQMPKIKLMIIGTGPLEGNLKEEVRKNNILNVIFMGYKTREEIVPLIRDSSFIIVPSEWYENLPMVIMEASALGKPVIASRIGGIQEMVEDGVNGFLFNVADVKDMVDKMEFLWDHPKTIREMGIHGREMVEKKYSLTEHYQAIMRVYSKLL